MQITQILTFALAFSFGLGYRDAEAMSIDFESFTDGSPLTNEISGLQFSGGNIFTAGVSLNEFDFPPHSGQNVLAALSGSLTISADNPFDLFSAYFTYAEQMTFSGFDVAHNLLFSFTSPTSSNLGTNSLTEFSSHGISSLVFSTQGGSGFTMDDLDLNASTVPEPGTLALLPLGALAMAFMRRQKRSALS
ncbi:PEP-CTERM sorting domain-containing protein [Methylomonas methanica]|uniref:Ice-binding protein C-terminal domain-containing protein n=1 Tax=Methylomonas methanica TaxID=421 RepID=A0A177MRR7_METMH|nr:PEP-CTERM sorting domain-containing protein [Methylomonas methanica]OAI08478.1 hypothetical protein A1332_06800 [Methylomonas methanica]